jgi:LPS sulfotransferase NodH
MIPFVLLTTQRSGSTVLVRTLDQHPGVYCAGELLHFGTGIHHEEQRFPYWTRNAWALPGRVANWARTVQLNLKLASFLDSFYARRSVEGFQAAGLKIMLNQVERVPVFERILGPSRPSAPRLLVLVRTDLLAMALSLERGRRTGQFHNSAASADVAGARVEVDVARMVADIRWLESKNRALQALAARVPHCLLKYEDFGRWDEQIARVLAFLGVDGAASLRPVLQKIRSRPPREEIANFTQLADELRRNGYGQLAD